MSIQETKAKSILRKQKVIDSWFISQYGMNLYRGCQHDCSYCDGRAESYRVEGDFANDISVKINAPELLDKELNPKRKRKPFNTSYIVMSGGVNDCYQPIERKYELSRQVLNVIEKWNFPVHVLTKSTLVERDLDILKRIHQQQAVLVSFSLSTTDDALAQHFEPSVPSPTLRLKTVKKIVESGIPAGVFLMPLIPLVSDTKEHLANALKAIKEAGAQYVIFGGMTLKQGRQRQHFYDVAKAFDPKLIAKYNKMYGNEKWGNPIQRYHPYIHDNFKFALKAHPIATRIPARFFQHVLSPLDFTLVVLSQLNYLFQLEGKAKKFSAILNAIYKNYRLFSQLNRQEILDHLSPWSLPELESCLNNQLPDAYNELMF